MSTQWEYGKNNVEDGLRVDLRLNIYNNIR